MADKNIPKTLLNDSGMERSVLSGIFNHGSDLFIDLEDIIESKDFCWLVNQKLFAIIKYLVHEKNIEKFDIPTILAGAKFIDYAIEEDPKKLEYLEALFDNSPTMENTKSLAACIYKLSIARQASKCIKSIDEDINTINGSEKIDDIIKKIEEPIFEFTNKLNKNNKAMIHICDGLEDNLNALSEDPKDIVGLPTGFSNYDICIGGGLRRGTVNVIGARSKIGKSFLCLNIAKNMAELGIPALYLDTELSQQIQMNRFISLITGVECLRIETGKFSTVEEEKEAVWSCKETIKNLPITHCSIAGLSTEAILSLCRRWIIKEVGIGDNGLTKPCLIIYDYLKLMNSDDLRGNVQETQLLGFLMSSLHNFALKFNVPILAQVQLNRDGVEREGSEVISGSDRILWLCSSFSILKNKSQEDLVEDGPINGTKKIIVCDTRFGSGMSKGDYINVVADLVRSKLREGKMFSQVVSSSFGNPKKKNSGD